MRFLYNHAFGVFLYTGHSLNQLLKKCKLFEKSVMQASLN